VLVISSGVVYKPSANPVDEHAELLPANPYALSKLAQDQLSLRAADAGLDVVVARPFNHIGPRQEPAFAVATFARQIALAELGRTEPVVRVGNLDACRDLTDVRDVVAAYEGLMEGGRSGEAYNVSSGRLVRMGDVLDRLLAASTVQISVEVSAERLRASDTPVLVGDARRIQSTTGWVPAHSLDETLQDTIAWWRATLAA
jgi:GDP-4-dehydro-6-deoxy-D-mannose reductase